MKLTLNEANDLAAAIFGDAFCAITVDGTCEIFQGNIWGEAKLIGSGPTFSEAFDAAAISKLEDYKF